MLTGPCPEHGPVQAGTGRGPGVFPGSVGSLLSYKDTSPVGPAHAQCLLPGARCPASWHRRGTWAGKSRPLV